ncbi:MAG: AEC family transporter [Verrucomicrobiales bacterium]|nr:AEC family transporter [Verrucomicrobiales bacterium]
MDLYTIILSATIPIFLVMAAGAVAHRIGWLADDIETGVMRLALNLLVPCLIIDVVVGNPALAQASIVVWGIGLGFSIIVLGFPIAYLIGRIFGLQKGSGRRTFSIVAAIQNYGYLPLPIIATLFPDQPGPIALVFIHGLGVEIALWTVGLLILSRHPGAPWKRLINGPFIAVVISLTLNYSGGSVLIPEVLRTAMHMLGTTAIPISIFMIGAIISRLYDRDIWTHAGRTAGASIITRLAILPLMILSLIHFLPVPADLAKVLIVQAGMPAAIMPIVVARLYGGHVPTAIKVVLITSFASILTAPAVIAFGMRLLGLAP